MWLASHLRRIGLEDVRVVPTAHHPIVYTAWTQAGRRPTILIYGHYDVQPAEPLEEWQTPPFDPVVRGDDLYGRGACDDKGQLFTHVKAIESYLKTELALPVNIKCIFEGDEETGASSGFESFIRRNHSALRADAVLMSDTRMLGPDRPALGYSQRGTFRFELKVSGPRNDLHSGNFGGAVHNPVQALCDIVASLHDASGRVTIPGFYDKVRTWSDKEREFMARVGPTDGEIQHDAHVAETWGESGFSLYERTTIRPALTVNGISGGYQGEGIKTIIPADATAKISIRTVPDQDTRELETLLRRHLAAVVPSTVSVKMRTLGASHPALINRNHPALRAASFAYRKGFGSEPVFLRSGGSVPAASIFQKELGIPTVLMGFGLPGDHVHAPNEKFHLPNLYRGIETSIWYLAAAANMQSHRHSYMPSEARQA